MHYLILAIIIAVSVIDQLTASRILPRPLAFLPELLSAVALLYVGAVGARQRFRNVRASYWFAFGGIALVMLCGVIANDVAPGPVVAGMRYYLRAIPIFFLPAVYEFKDWQIRQQLRLLLLVGIIQLPFAWHQRLLVIRTFRFSGDSVVGTLLDSSILSIYLICVVCVITALFLRKRLSALTYFILFFYLLAATTINETKGTLILLPIALFTVVLVGTPPARRVRIFFLSVGLLAIFLAGFIPVYDYMERNNPYYIGIEQFFTNEKAVDQYLDTHAAVGAQRETGRIDAVLVPLKRLSNDPVQLTFGLGIGNASHSSLGPQFVGAYFPLYAGFLVSSLSIFILEIGIFGTALVFVLYWLVLRDSLAVARMDNSLTGWIAVGWAGVAVLVVVATPYKGMHTYGSVSYLFWYFSGLIAARRMRLAHAMQQPLATVPLKNVALAPRYQR
jgi:hypothetical protein